jgi:hypothetical protein
MTDTARNQTLADAIAKLPGHVLSSVEFVADYVQLRFDGPNLTAYTPPSVSWGSENYTWGQARYRDVLCGRIGSRVESTSVDDQQVSIAFESGPVIRISLRDADYRGPEALQFSLDKDRVWVA